MIPSDKQLLEISKLGGEEDRARAQLAEAKGRLEVVQAYLKKAIGEAYGIYHLDVELGGHRCPSSPTKWCFYNKGKDRKLRNCIICHCSDER